MTNPHSLGELTYFVVEDRNNETIRCCLQSAAAVGLCIRMLKSTDGGGGYERFLQRYVHLSRNPEDFEKICFRRYFILYAEAKRLKLKNFVLLDSDLMFFLNPSNHIKEIVGRAEFAASRINIQSDENKTISPHVSYWTLDALGDFINFILMAYDPINGLFQQLREVYEKAVQSGVRGGVSDMVLLYLWSKSRGYEKSINSRSDSTAIFIDHNINVCHNSDMYEYRGFAGFKRVNFWSELPTVATLEGGLSFPAILHFQGKAKMVMPYVLNRNFFTVYGMLLLISMARKGKALKRRLFG